MRGIALWVVVSVIVVSALVVGGAQAAVRLVEVKADPAAVMPGDRVTLTAVVEDPGGQVVRVEAVVVEYPVMMLPLNDEGREGDKVAGDGVWTAQFEVPGAPPGVYHLGFYLRDAEGKALEAEGRLITQTAALEVKAPELGVPVSSAELRAQAAPWRTERQIAAIPARAAGEAFRFVVIGDTRSNPAVFAELLAITARLKPDFSLNTGDLVPGGQPDEFAFFLTEIKNVDWPFLMSPGNHDVGPSGGRLYEELFGAPDYHFDVGGWRFVSVNNSRGVITVGQLEWLDQALDTDLRKVVFTHAPPSVIEKWAWHSFSMGAQEFADLMAARQVDRVYLGHIHAFGVAEYKGVTYVLSGGGGAPLYERAAPGNFHHIVLVEVEGDSLRETVYKRDGSHFVVDHQRWITDRGQ